MDIVATVFSAKIQFYPPTPSIVGEVHRVVPVTAATLAVQVNAPTVGQQWSPVVVASTAIATMQAPTANVDIFMRRSYPVDRRTSRSAWQGRLGAKLDGIRGKALDNSLLLTAHPTDMLRVRTVRDERSHDVISRTVVAAEVLPIILPVMKDVPMRRIIKEDQSTVITFDIVDEKRPFEIYSALSNQLYRDDLLFRIIKDPYSDSPYLLAMQVKDELATIAYSSLLYVKYKATIFDEKLPLEIVEALRDFAAKREILTW